MKPTTPSVLTVNGSVTVRARVCEGLGFLGIELDQKRDLVNHGVILIKSSQVTVRVIPTDEE